MNKPTATSLIDHFQLKPLPHEGGYFVESYRAEHLWDTLPSQYSGPRSAGTAIYYLLTSDTVSRFHRLRSDEIWHFYAGDAVELIMLRPDGKGQAVRLGPLILQNEQCQVVVPRSAWQGAQLAAGGDWALMGCTVAPGFSFDDFELASTESLHHQYPDWRHWIQKLT